MATYFAWGSYVHAASEVQLAVTKHASFSQRGYRQGLDVVYSLSGLLISTDGTQATLLTQMTALENAYAVDGQNCGLYLDAALTIPTTHVINASKTIGGTRVISLEWASGKNAEMVFYSSYTISIHATFPGANNILEWHESISIHGTGGPRVIVLESLQGFPQPQTVCLYTRVHASQRGKSVGLGGYLAPPGPIWPNANKQDQQEGSMDTPTRAANGLWMFPSSWQYVFESNEALNGIPTIV